MGKPFIAKQPLATIVERGKAATFKVDVLGAFGAKYQWQFDAGQGWKNVVGGKEKILAIKKVKEANLGNYRCIIKTKHGEVVSRIADLGLVGLEAEGDAMLQILEETGKDTSPEVVDKAIQAVKKELPETLKE